MKCRCTKEAITYIKEHDACYCYECISEIIVNELNIILIPNIEAKNVNIEVRNDNHFNAELIEVFITLSKTERIEVVFKPNKLFR